MYTAAALKLPKYHGDAMVLTFSYIRNRRLSRLSQNEVSREGYCVYGTEANKLVCVGPTFRRSLQFRERERRNRCIPNNFAFKQA